MPAYLVSIVNVKDEARYMEYAKAATIAVQQYGGRILLRGSPKAVLEGNLPANRIVVSEWKNEADARNYYMSAEYAEAKVFRGGGVAEVSIALF
jgi:uncharacterized protein (DUF1330 family)